MESPATVLIVENDPTFCNLLWVALEAIGHPCQVATNAAAAWLHYSRQPSDLIVTDLHLAGLDGMELLHKFKVKENNVPIVVCSANPSDDLLLRVLKFPRTVAIRKPFEEAALFQAVNSVLATPLATFLPKRHFVRVPMAQMVFIDQYGPAKVTNLSPSGAFIKTEARISIGESIPVLMKLSEPEPLTLFLKAAIVWHQENLGYGVQFQNLSQKTELALKAVVLEELQRNKLLL